MYKMLSWLDVDMNSTCKFFEGPEGIVGGKGEGSFFQDLINISAKFCQADPAIVTRLTMKLA
jgi:hypothetical protein